MGRVTAERSGGRDQIRVFHSLHLGEQKETVEQARAGNSGARSQSGVSWFW